MKKLSIIIMLLLFTMTLLGCNKNETGEVYLDTPVNLAITDSKLSWDNVDDSKGYIVYEDGIQVEEVKTNEYTFNSNSSDRIIFTVRAIAPRGSEDSPMSLRLAYMPNYQDEVNAVNAVLDDLDINLSDIFAEELISRGMKATELEDMIDSLMDLALSSYVGSDSTYINAFNSISTILSEIDNYEAIVSALVVGYVPSVIQMQIDNLLESLTELDIHISEAPDGNRQDLMFEERAKILKSIELYEAIIDQIDECPDILVLSLCESIDYLSRIIDYASTDLVTAITDLVEMDNPTDASATELYQIADELKNLLEETKPTMEELVVLSSLEQFLYLNLAVTDSPVVNIDNLYGKRAYQLSLGIDAFIRYLDILDENYMTKTLENALLDDVLESKINLAKLNAEYLNNYLKTNEELLDNLLEVFSMSEQETFFKSFNITDYGMIKGSTFYWNADYILGILEKMSFTDVYNAKLVAKDFFEVFVEEITIDGTFIERYINYNDSTWSLYRGEVDGWDSEYQFTHNTMRNDLLEEFYRIVEVYNDSLEKEGFLSVSNVFFNRFIGNYYDSYFRATPDKLEKLNELFKSVTDEFDTDLYKLFKDGISYINEESYFDSINAIYLNYLNVEVNLEYLNVIRSIKNALALDDFLTTKRVQLLEEIIDAIIEEMAQPEFKSAVFLSDTDITTIETSLYAYLELLTEASEELGDIDLNNLTSSDHYAYLMYQSKLIKISNEIAKTFYDILS